MDIRDIRIRFMCIRSASILGQPHEPKIPLHTGVTRRMVWV